MAGPSSSDPLSYPSPSGDYPDALDEPGWSGLRAAFSADLDITELDPDIRAGFDRVIERIADNGAVLAKAHPATGPEPGVGSGCARRGQGFQGPAAGRRTPTWSEATPPRSSGPASGCLRGTTSMLRKARARYTTIWPGFFRDYHVLLTPSMPVTEFELGRLASSTINGVAVPESYDAWCALAQPANLAGLPAISVPVGPRRSGLPVGLQIIGARWADATVLRAAAALTACQG